MVFQLAVLSDLYLIHPKPSYVSCFIIHNQQFLSLLNLFMHRLPWPSSFVQAQAKQEFALWYSAKDHTTGKEQGHPCRSCWWRQGFWWFPPILCSQNLFKCELTPFSFCVSFSGSGLWKFHKCCRKVDQDAHTLCLADMTTIFHWNGWSKRKKDLPRNAAFCFVYTQNRHSFRAIGETLSQLF